jgi:hypothetical protein
MVGWILSAFLGVYQGKQMRAAMNARIGFFFYLFGGVVAGIMTRVVSAIIGSLSIAMLAVAGYYLVPAYFFLWTAIFCGLAMVGIGLVMLWRWR